MTTELIKLNLAFRGLSDEEDETKTDLDEQELVDPDLDGAADDDDDKEEVEGGAVAGGTEE